ncbi:hypothetical protein AXG93_3384s1530 [Marchantia polymorpha subsp. ruderalis]|uniref:Uncharacterized protein n=1 Tax=Marchantia polymorpha subsp. ruderalis TaxID=1480154 RepID=A0A176WF17_MARPO|nr:hypothetical protein AXG93_3384s1530 [Marchantia polymorpha subsp. ruderalis]
MSLAYVHGPWERSAPDVVELSLSHVVNLLYHETHIDQVIRTVQELMASDRRPELIQDRCRHTTQDRERRRSRDCGKMRPPTAVSKKMRIQRCNDVVNEFRWEVSQDESSRVDRGSEVGVILGRAEEEEEAVESSRRGRGDRVPEICGVVIDWGLLVTDLEGFTSD